MSFPDVRRFIAIMKVMGYSQTISMDSFRMPNFELVADCLHWLIMRYDPTANLDTDISIEARRVAFLKQAAQIMLSGARIKLNLRRLYSGDGYAVKELLKVGLLLYNATKALISHQIEVDELGPSSKAFDVKATRLLVNDITKSGASLYDILETEPILQDARMRAIMVKTDMDEIERGLKEGVSAMLESLLSNDQEKNSSERDEFALQAKLEKRKSELERIEKRLSTLQNVRPAYMDKYEALQKHLCDLFATYSEKFRNLKWLQSQMEGHSQEEQEKLEEADRRMRRLQRRLHEEELCILRGEEVDGSLANVGSSEESDGEGKLFWKWFGGSSFKSILDPSSNKEAQPSNTTNRMLVKGAHNWINNPQYLSRNCEKTVRTTQPRKCGDTTNITVNMQNEEDMKPKTSNSLQLSLNDSDISGEEDEDEVFDMDGMDPKNIGEDDSSDDDF